MACAPPYLGRCCGPPPSDIALRAVARVNGFTTFSRRLNQDHPGERQQLYNGFRLVADWNFVHNGVTYAGQRVERRERIGFNHGDQFPSSTVTGDPFPQPFGANFQFIYDTIETTSAIGRIRIRRPDLSYEDVGTMIAGLLDALPSAVGAVIGDANSYDPQTNTWGEGYPLDEFIGPTTGRIYRTVSRPRSVIPGLDIGTIAGACGAFPPTPPGGIGFLTAPTALTGHTAVLHRLVLAPRPGRQMKLVATYAPECGFPGPPVITECDAVDAEAGVDVTPSEMLDGYQTVTLAVTEHATGPSPC
jgi:hypothetical protein